MQKKTEFYYLEDGDNVYVLSPADRSSIGKSLAELDAECGGNGWILALSLKPPTTKLDREAKAMALVGDGMMGFRRDEDFLPAAQFQVFTASWELRVPAALKAALGDGETEEDIERPHWWSEETTAETFEALPPNLSDKIGLAIARHIRPRSTDNPDFFTRILKGSLPPSPDASPSS